jgi:ABC-type glycerol-3-phosphate transport system substrate-binding protein
VASTPLPTPDGEYYTLAQGWAWAISSPDRDKAELSGELAEFLAGPEFVAQWSAAAGLLPPRPSSLAAWSPDSRQALASQILDGAMALPSDAELEGWGGPLSQAVIAILKQELTAEEAMQMVLEAVANP